MADWLYLAACTFAFGSVLLGNRTAAALIIGNTVSSSLAHGDIAVWLVCDAAMIAAILWGPLDWRDKVVLAGFPVAWMFYGIDDPACFYAVLTVVLLQLLLIGPWPWLQRGIWNVTHGPRRTVAYGGA